MCETRVTDRRLVGKKNEIDYPFVAKEPLPAFFHIARSLPRIAAGMFLRTTKKLCATIRAPTVSFVFRNPAIAFAHSRPPSNHLP